VACGSDDSPTLPNVASSIIVVTVIPTPVEGVQNAATGAVSASYRISIQETAGLGCEVVFVSSLVFDPETGLEVARPIYYDSSIVLRRTSASSHYRPWSCPGQHRCLSR
jgi:hypothetical protein